MSQFKWISYDINRRFKVVRDMCNELALQEVHRFIGTPEKPMENPEYRDAPYKMIMDCEGYRIVRTHGD